MSFLFPESVSAKKKKLIRELLQGQEYATKLKLLLQEHVGADGSLSAKELVANVLRSFAETLSVMTCSEDEVADQNLVNSGEDGSQVAASTNDLRSEVSTESRKRSFPATKDRRGSYKRRKTELTRTVVSQTTDDEHAWRKYGQKDILNCKFPRSYFRCTRKYDQCCRATKQVQRIQDNPDMYQITYIDFHTCKDTLKPPQMVTYSDTLDSFLVNGSHPDSKVPNEQDPPISSQDPTIIKEHPKQETPSDLTDNLDPTLWSDLKDFELSKPATIPLKMASDNADTVYSCTGSQSLDLDFGVFSSHFGIHFDESNLL
ncbi:probable WRKY transcription factor 70 [Gastrolobium bilobum]|uniref:probable WRKY transcription factor 70 n=1 Tax=Gastrolobium bilobum TaxID=150636 RepID=UPI002AB00087|nr:probable WRKY transcription factor 70 [Gastrolobium bilobum]